MGWPKFFLPTETETQSHSEAVELTYPPSFDGRITIYPTEKEVRDYFSWRQVDGAECSMPSADRLNCIFL
jgi:tRNA(His) 5'-end guanylyltransferase